MAYLKVTLGVSKYSDAGRPLFQGVHRPSEELRQKVLERDSYVCRYCGFSSPKYQEVNFIGKGHQPKVDPRKDIKLENYATACTFCHQCFNLDKIDNMQSGIVVWLPEIGQAALNHIARAVYIAKISRGPIADAAKTSLETLLSRRKEAETILGTNDPKILGSVLKDFLESKEYATRMQRLNGFRVMPLDKRIIVEGDLEFNQFPQILAFWRSAQGPFGQVPSSSWGSMFEEVKNKIKS